MQKIYFLSLFILFFSCKNQSPQTIEFVNHETLDPNGSTMLIGRCTRAAMYREPYKRWYDAEYNSYQADSLILKPIKPEINEYSFTVFLGTWCGDSRREVPRFLKILDQAGYSKNIKFVMVDSAPERYKQSPTHEEAGRNIFKVPTFIIEKNGVEINRIIERPVENLEKDLVKIVQFQNYQPVYKGVARISQIIENQGISNFEKNLESIAKEVKPLLRNSSEANSFGYVLLGQKRFREAIAVMKLQTLIYPDDANVFDSLAEAYLISGKKESAIKYYEIALQKDPKFENAKEMLLKLKG